MALRESIDIRDNQIYGADFVYMEELVMEAFLVYFHLYIASDRILGLSICALVDVYLNSHLI